MFRLQSSHHQNVYIRSTSFLNIGSHIATLKHAESLLRLIFSARRSLHWNCETSEKGDKFHTAISIKNSDFYWWSS